MNLVSTKQALMVNGYFQPLPSLSFPGAPTLKSIKIMVNHLSCIKKQNVGNEALVGIPNIEIKQFASEAQTLNAAQMKQLEPYKKYALIAAMLAVKTSKAHDDITEIFIKK